ncbi:16823_t:CDS:2 [Acaulospora morrowiae]|uniref:V-type proton ATPase subunit G n=1 Tax=Acaulospora morrowiae TaxID=94023 RepID=A0A9N8V7W7_9GLOM|nr:16823_t:CDS:2 [Acaulospora morrowiae]
MAAQSSQGIQTLLEAEKGASKVVQQARNYRVQRLKDARVEAAKEIEALKEQKNVEFQVFEAEARNWLHSGSSDQSSARVAAETELKLSSIQEAFLTKKTVVIEKLLTAVTTVQPQLHRNVRVG